MSLTRFHGNGTPDSSLPAGAVTQKRRLLSTSPTHPDSGRQICFFTQTFYWTENEPKLLLQDDAHPIMYLFISCFRNDKLLVQFSCWNNECVTVSAISDGSRSRKRRRRVGTCMSWQNSICCHGYINAHLPLSQLRRVPAELRLAVCSPNSHSLLQPLPFYVDIILHYLRAY